MFYRVTLSTQRSTYANLLSNFEQLRIAEASQSSVLIVAEEAIPSYSPIRPRTMNNTMMAAAIGAMLAVGVAFLIEYLDDTIKTPDDIVNIASLSTLGAIGHIEGTIGKEKLVAFFAPRSPLSEAYRALRTNIQFAAVDNPLKSILVTSPGPGEGKSTTAANLGIVMAQAGLRVILIDADLRRPILHRFFELPNGQGLTTALLDLKTPATEHIQTTSIPGLRILTSGPMPPNPAELLGSKRQLELLGGLEAMSDVIILDSPPLLTVADALVIAPLVKGVLIVVEAGATRRGMLQKAVEALLHSGGRVIGTALNRMTRRRSGYYYYQYYQYYYSRYEKERPQRDEQRRLLPGLRK